MLLRSTRTTGSCEISESVVRRELFFFVFIREDKQMSLRRQYFPLSDLKTLSVGPAGI